MYYIDLFDRYTSEITQLALNHPGLFVQSLSILKAWEPKLDAFVNGRGEHVIITEEDVKGVQTYLDHLTELASPELRSVIDTERSILPLEKTVGMNMNQAWSYLSQDPRFPAVPEMWVYPYPNSSSNPVSWQIPQAPHFALNFDPNIWELVLWNNGIAASWELRHLSLYECVVTVPRVLADPYSYFDVTTRTLGELSYDVRSARFSEFTFYAIYKPLVSPESGEFMFIIYPGYVDTHACIDQSEALLANGQGLR